jgi:hypothetical protein
MRPGKKELAMVPGDTGGGFVLASDYWQMPVSQVGPVACASSLLPREQLLRQLVAALAGQASRGLGGWQELPLQLVRGSLGQPLVLSDGMPVLSVSFSQAGGRTWGALTGAGRVGIDVAFASEFCPPYPYLRVFSRAEFNRASDLLGGGPDRIAALLWSLKEAAVKALGVGFNYLSPREIVIDSGKQWQGGYLFEVSAGGPVKTWARPEGAGWLALALIAQED